MSTPILNALRYRHAASDAIRDHVKETYGEEI